MTLEQQALLFKTSTIGARETQAQKVKRGFLMEKAGLAAPAESRLLLRVGRDAERDPLSDALDSDGDPPCALPRASRVKQVLVQLYRNLTPGVNAQNNP